jgi:hypothetical protein
MKGDESAINLENDQSGWEENHEPEWERQLVVERKKSMSEILLSVTALGSHVGYCCYGGRRFRAKADQT